MVNVQRFQFCFVDVQEQQVVSLDLTLFVVLGDIYVYNLDEIVTNVCINVGIENTRPGASIICNRWARCDGFCELFQWPVARVVIKGIKMSTAIMRQQTQKGHEQQQQQHSRGRLTPIIGCGAICGM